MKTLPLSALVGCVVLFTSPVGADHHHADAPGAHDELGQVSFPTSCAAKVQRQLQRGVALLHSFGYTEAGTQFETVAREDPKCAMAHWGIAMTQFKEIWEPPDQQALSLGAAEMLLDHRPQEALAQYRVALQLSPNRLNALLSAAAAAQQAGLPADAHTYYALVAKQTANGSSSRRPDVARAVAAASATAAR